MLKSMTEALSYYTYCCLGSVKERAIPFYIVNEVSWKHLDLGQYSFSRPSRQLRRPAAMPLDWNRHREIIHNLYLTGGKSLKEVMAIMETKYGFHAT
jgi:Clr5 domain